MKLVPPLALAILISATQAHSAPVYFPGTGHYYEFVQGAVSWADARAAASASTLMGYSGYLVTITSAAENDFVFNTFNTGLSSQFAWIGAAEPLDDGVWRWMDGPEAGAQFSLFATATAPFNYANWGGIEPNDAKVQEDYGMMNIGLAYSVIAPGKWADAPPTPTIWDPIVGYIVEYVPEPSMASIMTLGVLVAFYRRTRGCKV